jgi:hypothetical protein
MEKTKQVRLMVKVYQHAKIVNIWLGLSNEHSVVGMEILSFLAGDTDFNDNPPWTQYAPELALAGLIDIIQRPYFRRIWVAQEVAVARHLKLTVGKLSFDWFSKNTGRFFTRLKLAELSPEWDQAGLLALDMKPLMEMVELAYMKAHNFQCEVGTVDIIHNLRHRQATDPRDMVFALATLAKHEPEFKVDYAWTIEEVHQQFFKHVKKIYGKNWR